MIRRKFYGLALATITLVAMTGCDFLTTLQTTVDNIIPDTPFDLIPNVSLPSFEELLATALGN